MKLSIICPICNERGNLKELVKRIISAVSIYFEANSAELILVDDGSDDGSNFLIASLPKNNSIKLVTHAERRGQAAAISSGLKVARGEIIIIMDSDLQVFPEDIPVFINKITTGYHLVNGIRASRKEVLLLRLLSKLFSLIVSILARVRIKDAASNFTAVRKEFIYGLNLESNDHRYIIPILKKRGAFKIAEVMIRHTNRRYGKSKYRLSKVLQAVPEFFLFILRFKKGYYDWPKE